MNYYFILTWVYVISQEKQPFSLCVLGKSLFLQREASSLRLKAWNGFVDVFVIVRSLVKGDVPVIVRSLVIVDVNVDVRKGASWQRSAHYLNEKKDVFERLSLWLVNLANSNHHSRQMTAEASRGTFLYTLLYSPCWRGQTGLSILCDEGNARAYESRMDIETDTYAFFVSINNMKTNIICRLLRCLSGMKWLWGKHLRLVVGYWQLV